MAPIRVAVVPHTHWDREWYATFETFRARLVELLDGLLPLLEVDAGYAHYLLDGQLAVVDDYAALRPDAEDRIRRLVGSGRMAVGPWYTLPDEFCVSGETLVRNLQRGLERAARVGGAMTVGYLPDMFGHVAQMPQILRLAGFDRAVVWRGVPLAVDRTAFWWQSPDGSSVLAEYLWRGYGNGAAVPDDAKALVERIRGYVAELGPALHGDLLFMNGTDHERPQEWLGRVVSEANGIADDLDIRITSLPDALAAGTDAAAGADLPRWAGELRSGARANLLMGVLSNRLDVKQAAAAAERSLERLAEPLAALWMPAWPGAMLDGAWLEVVRNAAHDSSCACSIDDVCSAVLTRYRSAHHTAQAVAGQALHALAATMDQPGLLIVNPTARTRGGMIEVEMPGNDPADGAQVLEQRRAVLADTVLATADARRWLAAWRSQQLDERTYVQWTEVGDEGDDVALTLHADRLLTTNILVPEIRDDVDRRLGADKCLHVRVVQPPRQRLLVRVEDVPGFGWTRWVPEAVSIPPVECRLERGRRGIPIMSNGLITVQVDVDTATWSIDDVATGLGLLVESGDAGDTYNYCPPDTDVVVAAPSEVKAAVTESGPIRARVELRATYTWPERTDDASHSRVGEVTTLVTTVLELRAGERFVRVRHSWDNRSRDHRVRAVFPLPAAAATSEAECAFAIVTRGLHAEGGATEKGLATGPSRRFVRAGGLTVVHDGLLEYELCTLDGASVAADATTAPAVALTLVRSTGMLSRVDLPYRPLPAGPPIAVEGAQLQGRVEASYALSVDPSIDPYAMADEVLVPLQTVRAPGGGAVTDGGGQGLAVDGAEVSALIRESGALTVRLHNPSDRPATARIPGHTGWVVDLRGRPMAPFEGSVALGPWQIATVRVTPS